MKYLNIKCGLISYLHDAGHNTLILRGAKGEDLKRDITFFPLNKLNSLFTGDSARGLVRGRMLHVSKRISKN